MLESLTSETPCSVMKQAGKSCHVVAFFSSVPKEIIILLLLYIYSCKIMCFFGKMQESFRN